MDSYTKKGGSNLATNWMVHVCILIILIIGFVLYDKIAARKAAPMAQTQSVPATNNQQIESKNASAQTAKTTTKNISEESASPAAEPSGSRFRAESAPSGSAAASSLAAKVQEETPAPAATDKPTTSTSPAAGGIQVSFYRISRQGLNDLQKISQAINFSGNSVAGILGANRIAQLVSGGEMQYISGNRYKDFDDKHPTMVFKGQRHPEAARNMGLFFQITSLRKNETNHLIEIKGWGSLKATEPDDNYFNGEMTLTPRTAAYVAGFLPRSATYSEDEKQLFESDRVLKTLNQEGFSDGTIDLIMFIEFAKSN